MKFAKQFFVTLLICASFLFVSVAFAQSNGDYNTPDSWRQHQAVSGTKFTMDGMSVGTGTLKLGLTSRYNGRFSDYSDQHFYQYLRGYLSDFELGSGTVRVALNLRAAKDLDGVVTRVPGTYHFAPTAFDAQADYKSDYWDLRIYDANVVLDNVLNYTKLTAGRFRVNYLTEYRVDGGELYGGTDDYNAYAYYGLPVSYYKYLNTTMYGGGLNLHFLDDMIVLRAELANFSGGGDDVLIDPTNGTFNRANPANNRKTKTTESVDTMTWKARLDLNFAIDGVGKIAPYGEFGALQDATVYEAGLYGLFDFGTVFNFWARGQMDNNSDPLNQAVSDYSYLLNSDTEYTQIGVNVYQGVMDILNIGVGFEMLTNSTQTYSYRDYTRFMGSIDFFNIIPNNYISLTLDYFDIQQDNALAAEGTMVFGGSITQNITPSIAAWLGAKMMTYSYDTSPVDIVRSGLIKPTNYVNTSEENTAYVVYLGGQWHINDMVSLLADFTYEMSDVIGSLDSDQDTIMYAELSLNVAF